MTVTTRRPRATIQSALSLYRGVHRAVYTSWRGSRACTTPAGDAPTGAREEPGPAQSPTLATAGGVRLYDTAKRTYLDFASVDAPLGHSPPSVVAAVAAQSATQAYHSSPFLRHPLGKPLADAAHRVFEADASLFFDSRGAAAAAAIALARRAMGSKRSTKRAVLHVRAPPLATGGAAAALPRVLGSAWKESPAIGAASSTQRELSHGFFDHDLGAGRTVAVVPPGDVEAVKEALSDGEFCAVVVEPIQLDAGMVGLRDGFLRKLGKVCREANAILVLDERRTSLGRAGHLLAWNREDGFQPDMTLLGSGLVSGMFPFSCALGHGLIGNPGLSHAWNEVTELLNDVPLSCSPMAAAAALETMRMLETPAYGDLRSTVDSRGNQLRQKLRRAVGSVDYDETPVSVRGVGLLTALSVGRMGDAVAPMVAESMARNGVITACEWNVIFMFPPIGASERDIDKAASVFRQSLDYVAGKSASKTRSRRKPQQRNRCEVRQSRQSG